MKTILSKRIFTVQDCPGYNSWPMLQNIGQRLVCAYSRGTRHDIAEIPRSLYARVSDDGGLTWQSETLIADTPGCGDVAIGKGLDENGQMLLWNRAVNGSLYGKKGALRHSLFRSPDGIHFTCVSTPDLDPEPMQITDVFHVPSIGLVAFWFSGTYRDDDFQHAWGMLTSTDNGCSWKQTVIESGLSKSEWPTEPSALYLGDGHIFVIARTESGPSQFQLETFDYGKNWTKQRTNISDVKISTPSLLLNKETGSVSNYYYHRTQGLLKRRQVFLKNIIGHPLDWPEPEIVTEGSAECIDAGNVNAVSLNGRHYIAYYSGKSPDTSVYVAEVPEKA